MAQTPRNVIFIGETGSGKSSVINLIADYNHAVVSSDAAPCTSGFTPYDVLIEGKPYRLWDTPGLNLASGFKLFRRKTPEIGTLKRFLRERCHRGELELLVFCVRGGRAHEAMSKAYKIFSREYSQLWTRGGRKMREDSGTLGYSLTAMHASLACPPITADGLHGGIFVPRSQQNIHKPNELCPRW